MLTDPISSFLNQLHNVSRSRTSSFVFPSSKMIKAIAQILVDKGFLEKFEEAIDGPLKNITVHLKVDHDALNLKRISKSGQRIYTSYKDVKRVRNGYGIALISTSKGILTDAEVRKLKIGGEYICEIY